MTKRPSWDAYFLIIADAVAMRADCTRRKVGAVVIDPVTRHIISTGYNGAPPGAPGCLTDGACPRGRHYKVSKWLEYGDDMPRTDTCGGCGKPYPCPDAVQPGSSYDTGKGACIALHAEQNAAIRAGQNARGAWMYLTDEPCDACWRLLKGSGFARIAWYGGEWTVYDDVKPGFLRSLVSKLIQALS